MFPGSFRVKLNSRSRHRAFVFATAVVTLHPSFLSPYPLLTYAYFVKYDDRLKSEEPDLTCLCVVRHRPCSQLSCNSMDTATRAFGTSRSVGSIHDADYIRIAPVEDRGKGKVVSLCVAQERCRWRASSLLTNWLTIFQPFDPFAFAFTYQQDTYVLLSNRPVTFPPLPYPSSKKTPLLDNQWARLGAAKNKTRGLSSSSIANLLSLYGGFV